MLQGIKKRGHVSIRRDGVEVAQIRGGLHMYGVVVPERRIVKAGFRTKLAAFEWAVQYFKIGPRA